MWSSCLSLVHSKASMWRKSGPPRHTAQLSPRIYVTFQSVFCDKGFFTRTLQCLLHRKHSGRQEVKEMTYWVSSRLLPLTPWLWLRWINPMCISHGLTSGDRWVLDISLCALILKQLDMGTYLMLHIFGEEYTEFEQEKFTKSMLGTWTRQI